MPELDVEPFAGSGKITARVIEPGVIFCEIYTTAYFMVGEHWRNQLTGNNKRKWCRIFIDPSKTAKQLRRRDALSDLRGLHRGNAAVNLDECPGAMFIWETQADTHVQPLCAVSNQAFGRDFILGLVCGGANGVGEGWCVGRASGLLHGMVAGKVWFRRLK